MIFIEKMTKFIIGCVCSVLMMFYRGILFSTFWGWFIVPLGVRSISTIEAISIAFVISAMFISSTILTVEIKEAVAPTDKENYFAESIGGFVKAFIITTLFFAGGWLWHMIAS